MVNEHYLEYLALDSILQGYMNSDSLIKNSKNNKGWYADGTRFVVDLEKLKERVTELQKRFLKDYVIS